MRTLIERLQFRIRKKSDHGTRVLLVFFLAVILAGTILLLLPVSSRNGISCGFMTALFTATSATCVTGLSTVDTFTQWSGFGQFVVLLLIQVGGLGYMAFISIFYFALRRRIGLRERLILQQAMALNELDGVVRLLRLMLIGTFATEGIGALILTLRFSVFYPLKQSIWMGIFHSVSAYCNGGFDLMGFQTAGSSLTVWSGDWIVMLTISAVIIIGGLGFFVWNDLVLSCGKPKRLSVYSRLVLIFTAVLIFGGMAAIAAVEWNNPETLGGMSVSHKLLAAFFQSVTTRTAGFYAISQGGLTGSGKLISILLMFVGGSAGSTAGGIKTVSVGIILLMAVKVLRNRRDVVVFGRKIPQAQINSAMSVASLVVFLGLLGGVILSATNGLPLGDCLYESVSAVCTVGLSTGITAQLNVLSRLILIVFMIFGRVGIMTISFAFMTKTPSENVIRRPETRILLG